MDEYLALPNILCVQVAVDMMSVACCWCMRARVFVITEASPCIHGSIRYSFYLLKVLCWCYTYQLYVFDVSCGSTDSTSDSISDSTPHDAPYVGPNIASYCSSFSIADTG